MRHPHNPCAARAQFETFAASPHAAPEHCTEEPAHVSLSQQFGSEFVPNKSVLIRGSTTTSRGCVRRGPDGSPDRFLYVLRKDKQGIL